MNQVQVDPASLALLESLIQKYGTTRDNLTPLARTVTTQEINFGAARASEAALPVIAANRPAATVDLPTAAICPQVTVQALGPVTRSLAETVVDTTATAVNAAITPVINCCQDLYGSNPS